MNGPAPARENQVWAIEQCIKLGYKVEVDLWTYEPIDDSGYRMYLSHDEPTGKIGDNATRIDINWLLENQHQLLIHCKNKEAIEYTMSELDGEWFVHEQDRWSGTSDSHLICYGKQCDIVDDHRILLMMPEHHNIEPKDIPKGIYAICTDYVERYKTR